MPPLGGANGSDLAAWARFGTLALFECRLLLQYDMVVPNSSLAVATLYLGPMGSLWAYIEGVDVPCLLLGGQTARIWLPGPGLALWPSSNVVCSYSMIWWCPIHLWLLQHCIWVPWEAYGHILKEWMSHASSWGGKRLGFGCLGQVWHSGPLRMSFAPTV